MAYSWRIEAFIGEVRVTAQKGKKQWAYVLDEHGETIVSPSYYRSEFRAVQSGVYEYAAKRGGRGSIHTPPTAFTIVLSGVLGEI